MPPRSTRLAAVDEANLVLDHAGQVNVFLCAGLLDPGGFVSREGSPDLTALRTALTARISALPELRRVPMASGHNHYWADVSPDLTQHIRLIEPVDGVSGLERKCGQLMSVPLALDRPPWELLVVPGASPGRTGVVLRIHHSIADGVAAVAIVRQLFGGSRVEDFAVTRAAGARQSAASPPTAPTQRVLAALHLLRRLGVGARRILTTLVGTGIGRTALLGERGSQRGVAFVDVDIHALKARIRPLGATVNDALLGATAAGYVALLSTVGENAPRELPVSVPVALRRQGSSGNQVGVMLVRLPLGTKEPDARLRLIAARTRMGRERAREQGTLEFMRGPFGARVMDRVARRQRAVAGFITNVPGPPDQMVLAGAPVVAVWPVAVLAGNVRLGVAAVSYAGSLWCTVHFDEATLPGDVFAQAMREEFRRLTR